MPKTVEVYIGFMEEEISPQLKALLAKYKNAIPVYAISRGRLGVESRLFEQPFDYYGVDPSTVRFCSPKDDPVAAALDGELFRSGGTYEQRIKTRILAEYNNKKEDLRKPKVPLNDPALTLLQLNSAKTASADNGKTPIACYVVQSPEMGKQPSVVRAYLRAILKSIHTAYETAAVRIVVVGAGGGIPTGINPGALVKIGASIFIGAELDDKGNLYAVVDIAGIVPTVSDGAITNLAPLRKQFSDAVLNDARKVDESIVALDSPLVQFMVPKGCDNALETAQRLATAFVTGKTLTDIESITDPGDPYYCVTSLLKAYPLDEDDRDDYDNFQKAFATIVQAFGRQYEVISSALNLGSDEYYRLSATWSFFDQKAEKDAVWHQLGAKQQYVANSNMEDYHVFRVLESALTDHDKYPTLTDYYAVRLTANPNASEEAIQILTNWLATTPTYSFEDYVETICWGIGGCTTEAVPDLPEDVCLWRACFDLETNTDVNDLIHYIYGVCIDDTSIDETTDAPWGELLYLLDPFCMDLAQDFLKELPSDFVLAAKKQNIDVTFSAVKNNPTELASAVATLMRFFFESNPAYKAPDDRYYMWLRSKWKQAPPSAILTPNVKINDHDRLLYRSGNVFAMRDLPDTVVNRD